MHWPHQKVIIVEYFDIMQDTLLVDTMLNLQRYLELKLPLFPAHAISLDKVPLFPWTPLLICHKFNQPQHFCLPVSVTVCKKKFKLFIEISWYFVKKCLIHVI